MRQWTTHRHYKATFLIIALRGTALSKVPTCRCKCSLDIANPPTKKVHVACQPYIQITFCHKNMERNILMLVSFAISVIIKFCLRLHFWHLTSMLDLSQSCKHRIFSWFFIPISLVFQATNNFSQWFLWFSKLPTTCSR